MKSEQRSVNGDADKHSPPSYRHLEMNSLRGPLPLSLCQLSNLTELYVFCAPPDFCSYVGLR
jgi:hypothetical protein